MIAKTTRQTIRPLAALLLLPLLALGSLHFWSPDSSVRQSSTVQVQRGDLLSAVTATGTVQAHRIVDIKYDTQSLVTHLDVQEGDHVKQDQPLATMDLRLLEPARAEALQMFQKDQSSLALAEASLHRAQALVTAQVLSRVELETAEANYKSLLHQTEGDRGSVTMAEENIRRARLCSPIRGVVIALYVHEGEMLGSATAVAGIGPNSAVSKPTNTLMTIAEVNSPEIDADVNAVDMGGAFIGQRADFTLDAFQGQTFTSTVKSIALQPTVTNGVTTYRVLLSVPVNARDFRIGMPSNIMLFRIVAKDAVLVPPAAVLKEGTHTFIFVLTTKDRQRGSIPTAQMNQPQPVSVQKLEVQVLGETLAAVALRASLPAGSTVLATADPKLSNQPMLTAKLAEIPFKPNPDLSDLQFERKNSSASDVPTLIPAPKPQGFLQRLFNP
jgi:HlyD family secretion protein